MKCKGGRQRLVVDFRNIYLTGEMARTGFTYISLGHPPVVAS